MQINQPCKIVSNDLSSLKEAALRIHQSKLVAFPTETVYGLGANALDAKACLAIYSMKKRPTTDPLIVHVAEKTKAYELIDPSPEQKIVYLLQYQIARSEYWHPDFLAKPLSII